jgi:glycosyltransferase involved in cell wall biosynthesis
MFLHDLLAITLPSEYILSSSFKPETQFFMRISGNIIDLFLTSTHYWANFVKEYMKNFGFDAQADVIQFGHNSENTMTPVQCHIHDKFVLSVATIEARKNHINLAKAWKLLKDSGVIKDEKLVIVGKWGWKVEEFKEYLNATNNVDGSIIICNNVGNDELTSLYQNCMFTVFPSLAEGYGLPIVESLCYGKLCITSNTTAMPEVGGIYAEYIDPYSIQDISEKIAKYLTDSNALQQKNQEITNFKFTSWEEASKFLFAKIKSASDHCTNYE